jgi:hypothetical protein
MDRDQFINQLAGLRSASTFLTLKAYRNSAGEIADYSVIFHMSYRNALQKSLTMLEDMQLTSDLEKRARQELITSFNQSLIKMEETPVEEIEDGYTRFFDSDGEYIKGVKVHTNTNTLHLYGNVVHKRVLIPGTYKETNRRPLTIAKDKLRSKLPVSKFRQFKIVPSQVDRISVENISLLPPE